MNCLLPAKHCIGKKLVSFHRCLVSGLVVALRTIVVTGFLSLSAYNLLRIALFRHALKIIDLCDPSIPTKQCLEINRLFQEDFGLFLENHSTSCVLNKFWEWIFYQDNHNLNKVTSREVFLNMYCFLNWWWIKKINSDSRINKSPF